MKRAPLMKSTSGIRGVVGISLDPPTIVAYSAAFATFVKQGTVVVGRDSRPSGEFIIDLVCSTLALSGCRVINLGIVPTPTVELAVIRFKAAGGIAVTASHNPLEWNALKFFSKRGEFVTKQEFHQLEKAVAAGKYSFPLYNRLGKIQFDNTSIDYHIKKVLRIKGVSLPQIKRKRLTAVVDAINGAGSYALPALLEKMGVKVIRLNCKGDGDFFRKPEPVPESLKQLGEWVKRHKADIGLACDPDADRLALVDEKGRAIGEELTLTLATAYYLRKKRGSVAINLSTSRVTADVARSAGARVYLSPVGESNVIAEMKKRGGVIGGEGNGGVILPECHYGRDALVAAVLVIAYLAASGKTVSQLSGTIPSYYNIKRKAPLPADFEARIKHVEKKIRAKFGRMKIDRRDGLRFDFSDSWVQIRKSNTEPIYRLIVESQSEKKAGELTRFVQKLLK